MDLHRFRRNYGSTPLSLKDLRADPIEQFGLWFELLKQSNLPDWFEINAMTLSTSDRQGHVNGRIVLLKSLDLEGFTFFTNYHSDKAQHLDNNPRCSLTFFWPMFERQVRVCGVAHKTSAAISDKYFDSRPEASRLGAIVSPQSQVISDETTLERRIAELEQTYAGSKIPRPDHWGGFCVHPECIEFWQGKPNRLHDRFRYRRVETNWIIERLAP